MEPLLLKGWVKTNRGWVNSAQVVMVMGDTLTLSTGLGEEIHDQDAADALRDAIKPHGLNP